MSGDVLSRQLMSGKLMSYELSSYTLKGIQTPSSVSYPKIVGLSDLASRIHCKSLLGLKTQHFLQSCFYLSVAARTIV